MLVRIRSVGFIVASCAIASGCTSYPPPDTIGGYKPPAIFGGFMSPQVSRTSCIDSVAREFKVPKANVTPTSDSQTMQDGIYLVTLSIGAGQPAINCTVNENGVVSDVVRAR
ncbi:hypothetical protein AB4Z46_33675 [Variovorax sp. M-6]|uniref:hypothetical protein n=1 Tax=Variovorax sp. M-6 TaxID=3233041 RepID=UPI003F97C777